MPRGAVDAFDQQEFPDADFRIVDNADQSKKVAFQLSGLTTATTRTLTVPDASGTLALTSDIAGDFTGDSGSGGVHGLVPAPAAGDAAARKVLGAGGGWVARPGLTLLGSLTLASSQTLSGLTLTDYKSLFIAFSGVSFSSGGGAITQNGGTVSATMSASGNTVTGTGWIDLATGSGGASSSTNTGTNAGCGWDSGLSTASTSITFAGGTFDAGTMKVYGL